MKNIERQISINAIIADLIELGLIEGEDPVNEPIHWNDFSDTSDSQETPEPL